MSDALAGIRAALEAGYDKIKLNAVLIGGFNDDEIGALAALTLRYPLDMRFIELMPMGENGWDVAGAGRMPDRERTGQTRGLLSPGEKERSIRVSREKLGGAGAALLEIISMRGLYRQVPVPEATRVIRFSSDEMRGPEP